MGKKYDYKKLFAGKEKDTFYKLCEMYFENGFGEVKKQDIDLLMFSEYLNCLIEKNMDFSDYEISKDLCILQSRVRELKKKKELKYPSDYKWKEVFMGYAKNAYFDKNDFVIINIPDVNVQIEVQHFIESKDGFVDHSLNSKLLKIPIGTFVDLMLDLSEDGDSQQNKETLIKEYNKQVNAQHKTEEKVTAENFSAALKKNSLEIIVSVIELSLPNLSPLLEILKNLQKRRG